MTRSEVPHTMVSGSNAPAIDGSMAAQAKPMHWSREMFLTGAEASPLTDLPIDVTGGARYLVFGPYVPLEPGRWRADVSLEMCADAARRPLALQFGVEPDYTTIDLQKGVVHRHDVRIEHDVQTPGLGQIRLWLKKAAFHGYVRFLGATVQRLECPTSTPLMS